MCFLQAVPRHTVALGIVLVIAVMPGVAPRILSAADAPAENASDAKEKSANGTFVSYRDGALTIKSKSGLVTYNVAENYKTYQNNEAGPGSKLVDTADALGRVAPGTVFRVQVEERTIYFGLDHRVIGTFESYADGKLTLLAADAPTGFVKIPAGKVAMTVPADTPVLESNGNSYQFAGRSEDVLKTIKAGAVITARSEFDVDTIEVIQVGETKRRIERYAGQTRATVRGTFVSFKNGVLRIRGKGLKSPFANEYDRLISIGIPATVPTLESIDGGAYQPASLEDLKSLKEGTIVTVHKVEEVVLEIRIGVAKQN